jgi:hypothetical protein
MSTQFNRAGRAMTNALLTSFITMSATGRVRLKADVLKSYRYQLGLSQEAFAQACIERHLCVSIASVKRAETGRPLLLRTARHLAEFHGLDLYSLLVDACRVSHDAPVTPDMSERRLVQVLCIWPVSDRERPEVDAAVLAEGATLMSPPTVDAVLAVFGLPHVQRSDLVRCVSAALMWQDRHVMLASGIWQDGTLDWPQDILQDWLRRQPVSIYVHSSVHGQVRALHQIDPVGHPDIGALGKAHRPQSHPFKLAGRQHEMRLFGSLLDTVLAEQQSQVMLVQGMAGMGKSRLIAEMVDAARRDFMSAVQIEIHDVGGDRYRAVIVNVLKSLLDLHDVTPYWDQLVTQRLQQFHLPSEQALLCKDLLAMHMSNDERLLLQVMGQAARAQITVQMLARIIGQMALQRPLLITLEDVHRASTSMIETFARIIEVSQESRVMWVFSGRVEVPQRAGELQRLIPDVAVTTLTLAPLRPHEARDLAQQFDHVDEIWRAQCMQRAQGHPLFLTQLLMADQRALLPDNFQYLLQMRLDEVSPLDRHALRMASVIGQAFGIDDMQALIGDSAYQLDALVQHCLLKQLDGDRYDFVHPLIRQGVYESLACRQREGMHEQVARHFEEWDPALPAHHLPVPTAEQRGLALNCCPKTR